MVRAESGRGAAQSGWVGLGRGLVPAGLGRQWPGAGGVDADRVPGHLRGDPGITRRIHAKAATESQRPASGRGGLSDIYIGGVHIHHQVWGILLVLVTGLLQFRYDPHPPWAEVLAALFGAGAALTLDEFALWLNLDDVYWCKSGRQSIDAILAAGALGVVLLMQASPVGTASGRDALAVWLYLVTVAVNLAVSVVCIIKGKLATGLIGIVVPIVATVGAIRLAKPSSVWARRRYSGAKLNRAQRRFGPAYQLRHDRLRDLLGGRPDPAGGDPVDGAGGGAGP
jgi:hypothetical protein